MKKYMLLFVGLENKPDNMDAHDYATRWQEWITELEKRGISESSLPFEWSGTVVTGGKSSELSLKETDVGGYMLINADSLDSAIDIAKEAPHMFRGGTTIIRSCIEDPE
jgi:hypothetical protein